MSEEQVKAAKILVVDDEPVIVMMIESLLTKAGYQNVFTTSDPTRVIDLFREIQPDLILLDLHMPKLSGLALLEELHGLIDRDTYLPILVITGDHSPEAKLRSLVWGAKDFLTKPFDATEVMLRVQTLLDTRMLFKRLAPG